MPYNDTKSAFWVSHSSLSEYLKCPLAYYYHYVYKDKKTNHKITIINPALTLGQIVHDTLDQLSSLPVAHRFTQPLTDRFLSLWHSFSGIKGGFNSTSQETEYQTRGLKMMQTITKNPGPLNRLAVKLKIDLPRYWLSAADNIILCGRIDWLEYLADTDSVHIIDFKTSKGVESENSLQLPIYVLLVKNCQTRKIAGTSYWYLNHDPEPISVPMPEVAPTESLVLKTAKEMLLKKKLNRLTCPTQGCRYCDPYTKIVSGKAKLVGTNARNQDMYVFEEPLANQIESEIL
jgi:hypothetical protein